ncbi:MAG: Rne/Rng family ribonuclease [Defluviicoccus sp.]|nr:Rne/Rng family ribonuclease [Defluviicoccus sp.]MDE0275147.1 Rne/Rng family ribonuclease [Defluviicoccus sp.]
MGESLLIEVMPGEIRAAAVRDGRVVELFVERRGHESLVGNVYLGRVERVLDGMDAAFVDIGIGKSGFLGLDGARTGDPGSRDAKDRIGDYVVEGEAVRVQVAKDAVERKGAQLTRRIAVAGRHLVYTPTQQRIAVSRQIADADERARLEALVGDAAEAGDGFIVRTASEGAEGAELADDAAYLRRLWSEIDARVAAASPPALVHEEPPPLLRLFRDRVGATTDEIVIDSPGGFAAARDYCGRFMPKLKDRLRLHAGPEHVFAAAGVEEEVERALGPRVDLPSGGELVIEATEALTAVDVNSGRFTGGGRLEDTAFRTNLEAADEAARQLRLRNIGGLILIDFIHMNEEANWDRVLEGLGHALAGDRSNVRLIGRTAAGLVEITRRRQRESLQRTLTEPCTRCSGDGRVSTPRSAALAIMRALKREARKSKPGPIVVTAASDVVDMLEGEAAPAMSELGTILGRRIALQRAPSYGRESFDIVAGDE